MEQSSSSYSDESGGGSGRSRKKAVSKMSEIKSSSSKPLFKQSSSSSSMDDEDDIPRFVTPNPDDIAARAEQIKIIERRYDRLGRFLRIWFYAPLLLLILPAYAYFDFSRPPVTTAFPEDSTAVEYMADSTGIPSDSASTERFESNMPSDSAFHSDTAAKM